MDGARRKYTGDHAVRDAIRAGESQLRSTTHIVQERVDYGHILLVSGPLDVVLDEGKSIEDKAYLMNAADEHQARLKQAGDWVIFPRTLLLLAEGRYAVSRQGALYFDGRPCPNGVRLEK